jgi:hypothetical protein
MRIQTMASLVRPVSAALLPFLVLFLLDAPAFAQERPEEKGRIENARWQVAGDVVIITYDLVADANFAYDVNVTLTRESNKSFRMAPRTVTGAIGKGKFAGVRMEIRWEYKKDVPQGLEGEDYVFEFAVNVIREEGGSNLWYYIGGLGLAGAAAAAVLLGGSKTSTPDGSTSTGLPAPPSGRPPSQ